MNQEEEELSKRIEDLKARRNALQCLKQGIEAIRTFNRIKDLSSDLKNHPNRYVVAPHAIHIIKVESETAWIDEWVKETSQEIMRLNDKLFQEQRK